MPGIGLGIAKCPYDPQDNSTAVWVESGNPGDLPALVIKQKLILIISCNKSKCPRPKFKKKQQISLWK